MFQPHKLFCNRYFRFTTNILFRLTGGGRWYLRLMLLLLTGLLWQQTTMAASFVVTNTNDAGTGSLRQAILDANAAGVGPHTITFSVYGQITILTTMPTITAKKLTIDGGNKITINSSGVNTVTNPFIINADSVTVKNFTLTNAGDIYFTIQPNTTGVTVDHITTYSTTGNYLNLFMSVSGNSTGLTVKNIYTSDIEPCNSANPLLIGRVFHFMGGTQTNLVMDNINISSQGNARGCEGIVFRGASVNGFTLTNSRITGVQNAIYFDNNGGPVQTGNNILLDHVTVDSVANGVSTGFFSAFNNTNVSIKNSSFTFTRSSTDNGDYAIRFLNNSDGITIDNCTIKDADLRGIMFDATASNVTISNSKVMIPGVLYSNTAADNRMIFLQGNVNTLNISNTILDADAKGTTLDGGWGIYFGTNATVNNVTLNKVAINNAVGDGIAVWGTVNGFQLQQSKFNNCYDGIEFYNNVAKTGVVVNNSSFINSTRSGIVFSVSTGALASDASFTGDTIVNAASNGIWWYSSTGSANNAQVTGCVIHDCGGAGVYSDNPTNIVISNNAIYNNGTAGIKFANAGNCSYTNAGAKVPVLLSSTTLGGGQYQLKINIPNITAGATYSVDIYANDPGISSSSGQYYVTTLNGLSAGVNTQTITYNTGPGATASGFWTATLRIPANTCGTSEFSSMLPITVRGPAGVNAGIAAWYRGDQGLSSAQWSDFSGYNINLPQASAAAQPAVQPGGMNFNPTAVFNGAQYFGKLNVVDPASSVFGNGSLQNIAVFAASSSAALNAGAIFDQNTTTNYGVITCPSYTDGNVYFDAPYSFRANAPWGGAIGKTNVWSFTKTTTNMSVFRDRATVVSNNGSYVFGGNAGNYASNLGIWYGGALFNGNIPEVIIYSDITALSATDRQKIESYLAFKYGVTLDQTTPTDYLASDGVTKMWSADPVYKKRVTGIGRDDVSFLQQKQSLSVDDGVVTIAAGNAVMASNGANNSTIPNDKSFLSFSDNDGAVLYNIPVNGTKATQRMARIWKVQRTNWADQSITLRFNSGSKANYLLISTDPAFATLNQELALDSTGAVTINSSLLSNGIYFTTGALLRGPANVNKGIGAWWRADAGGSSSLIIDYSGNGKPQRQPVAGSQPTFLSNGANFNPALYFNSNTYLSSNSVFGTGSIQNSSVLVVAMPTTSVAHAEFAEAASNGNLYRGYTPYSDGQVYFDAPYSYRINAPWGGTYNTPSLFTFNRRASGTTMDASVNNHLLAMWTGPLANYNGVNAPFYFGSETTGAGFNGNVAEMIVYTDNSAMTSLDLQKIQSYLALKYGITINPVTPLASPDYVATDGTVYWSASANSAYAAHITGIGRDTITALDQRQSRSADAGYVTLALGNSIFSNNKDVNATITNDKSFFVISDNNGTIKYTPINGLTGVTHRLGNTWKVQKTNWADQNITLLADTTYTFSAPKYLLISNDPTFATGTSILPVVNNRITLNSSQLANASYFTFATRFNGPAGVIKGIAAWYRADQGLSPQQWNDFSGTNINIPQPSVANQPGIAAGSMNFNPTATFAGVQYFGKANVVDPASSVFGNGPVQNFAVFAASSTSALAAGANGGIFDQMTTNNYPVVTAPSQTDGNFYFDAPYGWRLSGPWGGTLGKTNVWSFTKTVSNINVFRDRTTMATATGTFDYSAYNGGNYATNLGVWHGNGYFNGSIPEVIIYNDITALTATDRQKIESYLALKYGTTLDQTTPTDYLASDGVTKMWAADATYNKHITGIGRDDLSFLQQKQSQSVDTGTVAIALGTGIAASNQTNTNTITNDKSFFSFSDNGLTTAYAAPVSGVSSVNVRMGRIFKVTKTGWADQTITLKVAGGNSKTYLMVSADPTFATGNTLYKVKADSTVTLNSSLLANGAYFTFARPAVGPNGVNNGVTFWLRADDGVSGGSAWNDYSNLGNTALQPVVASQPTTDAKALNFNYGLLFDGAADFMDINTTRIDPTTATIFAVASGSGFAAVRELVGSGAVGSAHGMEYRVVNSGQTQYLENAASVLAVTGSATALPGKPYIFSATQASNTPNGIRMFENYTLDNQGTINLTPLTANLVSIGSRTIAARGFYWMGNMGEVVAYNRILSDAERQSVESYLGLKYGITINNGATDYLATDGTKYWNADAVYKNRITGIGRDDSTALNTKQSLSVDTGFITVALGNNIAITNSDNTNTITNDKSFLVFADNGLSAVGYPVVASTPLMPSVTRRMARVWKMRKTAWADQNITIQANINGTSKYLLVSNTDPNFAPANITQAIPFNGNQLTFNSSNIPDGAYFTIGAVLKAPGGVTNNVSMWVKADDGITQSSGNVSNWLDQSGNNTFTVSGTAPTAPLAYVNFNPLVRFGGAGKLVGNTSIDMAEAFTANAWTGAPAANRGAVVSPTTNAGDASSRYFMHSFSSLVYTGISTAGPTSYMTAPAPPSGEFDVWNSGGTNIYRRNATSVITGTTGAVMTGIPQIGDRSTADGKMTGDISEIVLYSAANNAADRNKIETYLAIKYGITLNSSYTNTANNVIWDTTANTGFNNNIAGIGRDDIEDLQQRQSRSINSGTQVAIGLGSLAETNKGNTNAFAASGHYLVWGDDNNSLSFRTAVTGHPVVNYRMSRLWKVAQTAGMNSQVQVAIPYTALPNPKQSYLIVSDDNVINGADQFIPLQVITLNGVKHYAANVTFNSGQYFSFGGYIKSPGGIAGTALWLRPDYGTSSSADNTPIDTWTDFASYLNNALQPVAASQPKYVNNTTDNINYNPALKFSGSNFMNLDVSKLPTGTSARTLFGVGKTNTLSGNGYFMSWGANAASQGSGIASISGAAYFVGISDDVPSAGFWQTARPDEMAAVWAGAGGTATLYSKTKQLNALNKPGWNTGTALAKVGSFLSTAENWNGAMGDLIVYPFALNPGQLRKVESYLGIKYGYTLDQTTPGNYLATDSTVIWDATANAGYNNNIAGIGYDEVEGLNQKQSRSINAGAILSVGLNSIETDNITNTATFGADKSYMIWGSNSNLLTAINTNLPSGSCVSQRLSQQWKVQYSNFNAAQLLAMAFDLNGVTYAGKDISDFSLLIDNDGDGNFATGTITEIKASAYDSTNKKVLFNAVSNIPAGAVFTITTSHPVRTASLVADGAAKTAASICKEGNWIYFIDPADATKYIAAIDLNGNTANATDFGAAIVDVSKAQSALGASNGTNYGIQLMRRLLQISYTGAPLTTNGGVKLRLLWDPAGKDSASTYLSGTRNVSAPQQWTWFKHTGDIAATMADITPENLNNITALTPAASGTVDGVNYVQFNNLQNFSVFGGLVSANQVLSIQKAQDGAEGGANGAFTISLPTGITATEDITINYSVGGSATNGADYNTLNGTVVLKSGAQSVSLPVLVIDDKIIENTETVAVTLTGASGLTSANPYGISNTQNTATLNITDNDLSQAVLSIRNLSDAAEPATNGAFVISLPAGYTSSEDVPVNYTVAGTATNGVDYTALKGTVVLPAGQNGVPLPVNVIDDKIIEGNETVTATLVTGKSASFTFTSDPVYNNATVNIADDDNTAANEVLSITKTADAAEPSTNGAFSISLPAGITCAQDITVNYTLSGTATNGTDYTTLSGSVILPAGKSSVSVPVNVIDDKIIEGTETVVLTLTGGTSAVGSFTPGATNGSASLDIADDDNIAANEVLSITKTGDAAEPNTNAAFTVSLPAGVTVSEPVTVNLAISGTATNGTDYTTIANTVVIPAGKNSVSVPVNVIDDKIIEGDETAIATITGGASTSFTFTAGGATATSTMVIADDDDTAANKSVSLVKTADAAEPSTNGAFTVSLPTGITAAWPVTVHYLVSGTATKDVDYQALSGVVVIPAGQNGVQIPVNVIDDKIIENKESVVADISSVGAAAVPFYISSQKTDSVIIADDDNIAANEALTITKIADAAEPATNGSFSVSLPAGITVSEDVRVNYGIAGTATNGADYTTLSGSVIIPAGQNSVSIPVNVIDDKIIEGNETVALTLKGGASTSFTFTGNNSATLNIADDDNIAANQVVSVAKAADAVKPSTNGAFTISLPAGYTSSVAVTVTYTVSGTATAGTDYATLSGTVVIPAGQNSVNVPVTLLPNPTIKPDQTVIMALTGGTAPGFGAFTPSTTESSATVVIRDPNNIPANKVLSITKTADAAEPATNGSFSISLPTGVTYSQDITVNYTIGGTATNGTDYTALSGVITIPAGQNSVALPVNVIDDKIIEGDETVVATLVGGSSANFGAFSPGSNGTATLTIADDDNTPANQVLNITKTADAAEPATNGAFSISLPAGITAAQDIQVSYTLAGTATPGKDYSTLSGSVIIPAGQNSVSVPVIVIDDKIIEPVETVIATITGGTAGSFSFSAGTATATVNIADDDNTAANKALSITKTVDAAEPATNGAFSISLPAGITAAEDVTVSYTVAGTATPGADYTTLSGTAVIPAGQNSISVPVNVIDDKIIENTETVVVTLTGGTTASLGNFTAGAANTATVNIADDDNTAANEMISITKVKDAAEPSTNGAFLVSLPAGITVAEAVTVNYTISGTATNGVDYTTLSGSVVIPAGQNSVNIPVNVIADNIVEGDETVVLTVTGGTSASFTFTPDAVNKSATVIIADNSNTAANKVLSITKTADAAEPATNGAFLVSLPAGVTFSEAITATYTVNGTATNGVDYTTLSGSVVIPAGQNSASIPLNVIDDKIIEGNETVVLTLTGGSSASFGALSASTTQGSATANIADDDNTAANKTLSIYETANAAEPATNGAFTLQLPAGVTAAENITATYTIAGTATNGVDYTTLSGAVVIPAGQNSVIIPVNVIDDKIIENTETVIATLTAGTSTSFSFTADAAHQNATVTIADDDNVAANKILSATAIADAAEPATNGAFRIALPAGITSSEDVSVTYAVSGTATNGVDYTTLSGTVTIPAGQNSVSVPVIVIDDKIIEGAETVIMTLTGGASASFGFAVNSTPATVNIADDDNNTTNRTLRIAKTADAAEPATDGNFRITLPAGITAANDITINYTIDPASTATSGADYQPITSNIIIPAGQNGVNVPVHVIDDNIIEPTETVIMHISGGNDALFAYTADATSAAATVNIYDNDFGPNSNVVLVTKVSDAVEGGVHGQYKISLQPGVTASEDVTIHYTMGGSATNGVDYPLLNGVATIPAGSNFVLIDLAAIDDQLVEGPETAILTMTSAASPSFAFTIAPGFASATVNIIDVNAAASTPISIVPAGDAAEPATNGKFTIKLNGAASSYDITVGYSLAGTATAGLDYSVPAQVVIPAGQTSVDVTATVIDDKIIEGTETIQMTIVSGSAIDASGNTYIFPADPAANQASINILDDDNVAANRTLSVQKVKDAAEPNTNGAYMISLPTGYTAATDITVNYAMSGTATRNADYTIANAVTIPAGQNSVQLPLNVLDDKIIELTETAILTITNGTDVAANPYTPGAPGSATVNIADDDATAANLQVSVTKTTDAAEPAANGLFTFSLPAGVTVVEPVTVNYTVSGTATPGADYTALSGTVVIPAGQNSVGVPVSVIDDKIIESTETIIATVTGGTSANFTFAPGANKTAVMTLADDDNTAANRVLSVQRTADAAEPATNGSFEVSLPAGITADAPITFSYTLTGTATREVDYTVNTIVLPAGQNSVPVPVNVIDDKIIEGTETVIMTLGGGTDTYSNAYTSNSAATVNIADDDSTAANKQLTITKVKDAAEPATNGAFNISLPAGITAADDITVNYSVSGTATNGVDYTTLSGTVVLPRNQQSVNVPVNVIDDKIIEGDETVILTLNSGTSAALGAFTPATGGNTATLVIADDDTIAVNRLLGVTRIANAAEPATNGSFSISLPGGVTSATDITVNYTMSGVAINGTDYTMLSGAVVLPKGQSSVPVVVAVIDDKLIEGDESVVLTLSGGASGALTYGVDPALGNSTLIIADDDNIPANKVLSVAKAADATEPNTNGAFTISLPTGVAAVENVTVQYTISGTATNGVDYTTLNGTAVIPAGQNSVSVPVNVIDDKIIEGNETVIMTLNGGASASFGSFTASATNGMATVNIADDDNVAANELLSVTRIANAAEPAANGAYRISLPAGVTVTEAVTLHYNMSGTATNGVDYTLLNGTAIIPAGQQSVIVNLNVIDDKIIEGDETAILTLSGGNSASFTFAPDATAASATITIADDDNTMLNKTLSITKVTDAAEPATNGAFMVSLPAGVTAVEPVTVTYTVTGSATSGVDYQALSGTVTIPANQQSALIPVIVIDDKIIEPTETVIATITKATAPTLGAFNVSSNVSAAVVDILDDDNVAANTVISITKTADAAEPATNGAFTVSLPAGVTVGQDVTVSYTISGTATNGVDYTKLSGTLTIPANQNSIQLPVQVIDDKIIEGPETVVVTLTQGVADGLATFTVNNTANTATVIIADDDDVAANKVISIAKVSDAAEPNTNGAFSVSLPAGFTATEDVTVNYTIAGTATNGVDYTTLSGSVVIPAGQHSASIPVTVIDDKIIEGTETVSLTLRGGTTATLGSFTASSTQATATLNIADDDDVAVNKVISITKTADAAEPATNGAFTVSLPAGVTATDAITVNYTVSGTATNGVDYTTLNGAVVIPAGQHSVQVPVTVIDDKIIEGTETVILTVTGGTSANFGNFTASAANNTATVNIADDDDVAANKLISVTKVSDAAEPATNGAYRVSLPAGVTVTEDVTVHYNMSGTASNGADYTTLNGTVLIPAGQNSVTVDLKVIDDKIIEGDETAILTISAGSSTSFAFTADASAASATITIADDDNISLNKTISVTKTSDAAEPATNGAFSVSLPAGITATEAITVNYTIAGTATNGVDYTTLNGTVVIPAGQNSVSVPVNVIDDKIIEGTETVILTVTGGTSASFGSFTASAASASATVNIADDDDLAANMMISIAKTADAAEPATNGSFRVSLPAGIIVAKDITVNYAISGSALGGKDYQALTGSVLIPAGASYADIPVVVIDNLIVDGTRTVQLTITGGTAGSLVFAPAAANTATVSITDNDMKGFDTWKTVALPAANTDGKVHQNDLLTYTIYVRNTGNVPTSFTITDPVPANTSYVSGGTLSGGNVTFNISNLAAGAVANVTFVVKTAPDLTGVTEIINTAQVNDGTNTKATGSCDPQAAGCSLVPGTKIGVSLINGDLAITKAVVEPLTGPYRMGQDITYSIQVKNTGSTPYTNVLVKDSLPAGLDIPKSILAQRGTTQADAGKLTWNIGQLGAGEAVTLTYICRIIEGHDVTNTASVSATEPEKDYTNNTATVTLQVEGQDLMFPNVITPNGDGKNERFVIGGLEKYPGSALYIYNRWGNMVYQSKDYHNDWNGSALNDGTYYYILEVRTAQGTRKYKGWIEILR